MKYYLKSEGASTFSDYLRRRIVSDRDFTLKYKGENHVNDMIRNAEVLVRIQQHTRLIKSTTQELF